MPKRILISRVDNLGDVVLTLPVAGAIKDQIPNTTIFFLGKQYTRSLIEKSSHIENFIDWSELEKKKDQEIIELFKDLELDAFIHIFPNKRIAKLASKANVPLRVGTGRRLFHFLTCNHRPNLSRKNSDLHEAQLNLKLLEGLNLRTDYSLEEISGFYGVQVLEAKRVDQFLAKDKFNLILHPLSHGSAQEWGLENYGKLIEILPKDQIHIIVTGTKVEADLMREKILNKYESYIMDTTGKLTLDELIGLISISEGLVAASTGPLHVAACLGIHALGLYSSQRPIYPERWGPLGPKVEVLKTTDTQEKISSLSPETVRDRILNWINNE